jgi:hypothetical protein
VLQHSADIHLFRSFLWLKSQPYHMHELCHLAAAAAEALCASMLDLAITTAALPTTSSCRKKANRLSSEWLHVTKGRFWQNLKLRSSWRPMQLRKPPPSSSRSTCNAPPFALANLTVAPATYERACSQVDVTNHIEGDTLCLDIFLPSTCPNLTSNSHATCDGTINQRCNNTASFHPQTCSLAHEKAIQLHALAWFFSPTSNTLVSFGLRADRRSKACAM